MDSEDIKKYAVGAMAVVTSSVLLWKMMPGSSKL